MSNIVLHRITPRAVRSANGEVHPAIVEGCLRTFIDQRAPEISWEAPTRAEWRRLALIITKQVALHVAGYCDKEEFARDGRQFAWNVFESLRPTTRRSH